MNVHVPFAAAMVCGCGRSSGRGLVFVVATMARNFDSGAVVVLVVTVVRGRGLLCDTRFTVGDLARAHVLLQVPFSAAKLCGRGRDRGRVGGCSHNNNQGFWLRRWLSITVIDHQYTCNLPRACCNRNTRVCTQGGLGSCAFIAITRHIKCQLGNWRFVSLA